MPTASSSRWRRWPVPAAAALLIALVVAGVLAFTGGDDDTGQTASTTAKKAAPAAPALASRPDLRPPTIDVRKAAAGTAPGLMLVAPKKVFGAKRVEGEQQGPMVVDDEGRVRWFHPLPKGETAYDLRVQEYRGEPVITWWQGRALKGSGKGVGKIYDTRYRQVAEVESGTGADADIHEFLLTPRGTALMLLYESVEADLTSVGGKAKDKVVDGVVREIDVETGEVLFEWRSLDHIDLDESHEKIDKRYGDSWDYVHLNSIDVDTDGNLLISARHTWATYKLDRKTGEVIWRLGGKRDDFGLPEDLRTSWQHDSRAEEQNVVRIFDNAAASKPVREQSRVLTLELDPERGRAKLVREIEHPDRISSGTQANAQLLPGGHTFVGWGSQGVFSEFDEDGELVFDARVQRGYDTYRAYRARWSATPPEQPAVAVDRAGGAATVHASWNGATAVRRWQAVAGASPDALEPIGEPVAWDGLETTFAVQTDARYIAVQALDGRGKLLAQSSATSAGSTG